MNNFENKSLEWIADKMCEIDFRIADRTKKYERKLTKDNRNDQRLLEELSIQMKILMESDAQGFIDWAIKNKAMLQKG